MSTPETGRELAIPELALVLLIGASGSGKSTFGREKFGPFEVISSDYCRALVSGDENDQSATAAAFEVLHLIAAKRLAAGLLTVIDATNVQGDSRKSLIELARAHHVLPVAIVLDMSAAVCSAHNALREDRNPGPAVIARQRSQLSRGLRGLGREGLRRVHILNTPEEAAGARIIREKLRTDKRDLHGPFDVIGDVHGCRSELETLLSALGYRLILDESGRPIDAVHPENRTVIFLGDLVDRGPDSPGVLRLAMGMERAGHALAVPGNHEHKLIRALDGHVPNPTHGLAETLDQLARESPEFRREVRDWCYGLVSHLVLDDGKLVVAHAGLIEEYHGRSSGRVRSFALYGDTTGEIDEFGLPVRYPWAEDYRGSAMVLYGHTPIAKTRWINGTLCLDTGCVFGGALTALNYPEKTEVSVPAEQTWADPIRPFLTETEDSARPEDELRLDDVVGRRVIATSEHGRIAIREENAAGALEVMSRFALPPRWLPYLPPTMAPVSTSKNPEFLEHPEEAFADYRDAGIRHVLCEEKHMGSRATILLCRDAETAARVFRAPPGETGAIYTRTGRAFFDAALTEAYLGQVREAVSGAGIWSELDTDWILLDGEILPWSLKSEELLRTIYAPTAVAARSAFHAALRGLDRAADRGVDVSELRERTSERAENADLFTAAYRGYIWPVAGLEGVKFAPFQVLASASQTHYRQPHEWHLALADRLVSAAPHIFQTTRRLAVDTGDADSVAAGIRWWEELTGRGGEGMVVKPAAGYVRARKGLAQPGLKVRGREYLRIIYGPDYTMPENLSRLKDRNLGLKRSLALREYALGLEALDRLAAGEPLWRIHEPVFAVLALEFEPVDPRL